ncbi:putative serine/threonine-protein kinase roco8 [Phytophthora citrophthora]|uniref:Serine/threonine-protein kinase roco8 n=1 Tax=Phytophthora citrophthora TaxID=4793 RepID=A0AAD9LR46_9STRA|nr:putative serine/threonine-protein kinase roco8 [Phytophthora citrophthora]
MSCTRNQTALTTDCNSLCPEGRPCIAYAAGNEGECTSEASTFGNCTADDFCTYECFATGPDDFAANGAIEFSVYTFLIPFGDDVDPSDVESSWSTEQEKAVESELAAVDNLTTEYPSKSNDALQHIEPLDLMTSTKSVVLAGGSSVFGVRGKVARVQLPQKLFTEDTELKSLTLANLGLEQILESSLSSGLLNLTISNCLMTSYPEDLHEMSELENLDLSKNYFGYFPADLELPKLQTLNLSMNTLASFEGAIPSLNTLDVSSNNFTSIPSSIFDMTALQRLYLGGNNFTHIKLTTTQFSFFQSLDVLDVDSFGSPTCNTTEKLQTSDRTLNVCVSTSEPSEEESSSNKALIAGVTAAAFVLFLILIIISVFRCLRRRALAMKPGSDVLSLHRELISPSGNPIYHHQISAGQHSSGSEVHDPPRQAFPYGDELGMLVIDSDELEYIRKLISEHRPKDRANSHREAFLTKFRGSRFLVCKRLHQELIDNSSEVQRFAEEIHLAASLDHPRIVALVGVIWSRVYGLEALFEYMEGGNLRSYLAEIDESKELKSWRSHSAWKLQVAFDVAEALAYAHAFSPTLVHRNLTSHSVLLSSPPEFRARLDDFVLTQHSIVSMSTIGLSHREERWLSPEVITGTTDYSPAADMYAFGVILSEIDTHSLPYENIQGVVSGRQTINDGEILDLVASGKLHPVFTLGCPTGVRELAEKCMSFEASDRPTALQTVIVLRSLLSEDRRTSYTV